MLLFLMATLGLWTGLSFPKTLRPQKLDSSYLLCKAVCKLPQSLLAILQAEIGEINARLPCSTWKVGNMALSAAASPTTSYGLIFPSLCSLLPPQNPQCLSLVKLTGVSGSGTLRLLMPVVAGQVQAIKPFMVPHSL